MRLLHHEDIVSALRTGLAPADIFEVADAAALAIHIIRNIAVIEENGVGIINHLPRRLPFADRVTVFSESGCGFQSEGMDGYIRRRERDDSVNGFFEALERITGESRDKIDIYIFKPALLGESIRRKEICRCVLSADRFEHGIVEGLGIYAYSVDLVGAQDIELLLRYGIWSAEFDGIFAYSGQIEAVFDCRADLFHLLRAENTGCSAADIYTLKPQSDIADDFSRYLKLPAQVVNIDGQKLCGVGVGYRMGDERALAAP